MRESDLPPSLTMKKSPFAVDTADERRRVLPLFRERALRFARSRGLRHDTAEEFASFAMIAYLQDGRYELAWHLTDFMRAEIGRTGTPGYEKQLALATAATDFDFSRFVAPAKEEGADRDLRSMLLLLRDERMRRMLSLYLEGHTFAEIGEIVGRKMPLRKARRGRWVEVPGTISESRVCQMMNEAVRKIRRRLGLPLPARGVRYFHSVRAPRETRFCQCGCNEEFLAKPGSERWFIAGHKGKYDLEKGTAKEPTNSAVSSSELVPAVPQPATADCEPVPQNEKRRYRLELKELPEIEKGIPIPETRFSRESPYAPIAEKMAVNDSVKVDKRGANALLTAMKKIGKKGVSRSVGNEEYRVWCTAVPPL